MSEVQNEARAAAQAGESLPCGSMDGSVKIPLCGVGVLVLAIWLRLDPRAKHFVHAGYAEQIHTYYLLMYILMAAGGVMTFLGFLGCCGAFQESRGLVIAYACLLFIVLGAEVACGVLAFMHKYKVEDAVSGTFQDNVKNEYGKGGTRDQSIDYIQSQLQCCGGNDPRDWHNSFWMTDTELAGSVPASCCKDYRYLQPNKKQSCAVVQDEMFDGNSMFQEGCQDKLTSGFQMIQVVLAWAAIGLAIVQLFGLVSAIALSLVMTFGADRSQSYKVTSTRL